MSSRLSCNPAPPRPVINRPATFIILGLLFACLAFPQGAAAGDAPQWMHALVNVPLPDHDQKTDAILLYSERNITVFSADKIKTQVREVYKILRPAGRDLGTVVVYFNSPGQKVSSFHGWCIPAQGKDYEVKEKDAMEMSPPKIDGGELVSDLKVKLLRIPAPDPGNLVGYEYEVEDRPEVLQDSWEFQGKDPVRESHYSLQLPPGWESKTSWINHSKIDPESSGGRQQWVVRDVRGIRMEEDMPPFQGIAGQMVVSFFPPGGAPLKNVFSDWKQMGVWYLNLTSGRLEASPEIKHQVTALTAGLTSPLEKMRAIAKFVQHDVRYVAIELGIGGWQPHPAADVFMHRYGDCKDKVTLMRSMLHEIGVESYHVVINTRRGSISPETPAYRGFDHAIIAVALPKDMADPSLLATLDHPALGKILFFDPTNDLIPFGQIGGYLQANYGLLVAPGGGELVELPKAPSMKNSVLRRGQLTLDASGTLRGDINEVRYGDRASYERDALRSVTNERDKIKPIERTLAESLSTFHVTKASIVNLNHPDLPFGLNYSFDAENYATNAGDLLLVRVRTIGTKSSALLETREPRVFPIEFDGLSRDTDTFDIAVPPGYIVEDLPPPVSADFSFASYHSRSEVSANVIHYNRTFEVKEVSVPVSQADDLKKLYRIIATDERNTAVLKLAPPTDPHTQPK